MHACIHKTSGFIGGKGPRPLKIVILPDKGKSVNLDFDYLRLDFVHKDLCALIMKALKCITLKACEAWHVVV